MRNAVEWTRPRMNAKTQWHNIVKFIAEKPQKFINQNYEAEVSLFEFAAMMAFFGRSTTTYSAFRYRNGRMQNVMWLFQGLCQGMS